MSRRGERVTEGLLCAAAYVAAAAILLILLFLVVFSTPLLREGGLGTLLGWSWRPDHEEYGVLTMVVGSLVLSGVALSIAFPLAIGTCLFVHGLGPPRLARVVFAVVSFMTSIPTVVYAFVAVLYLVPLVRRITAGSGFSVIAASFTLALLILPTIVLLVDASWRGLEPELRTTGAALGLNRTQVLLRLLLPASGPGLAVAAVLGFGRAIGDTMIALLVSGNAPQLPHSPGDSIRALTAHVALVFEVDTQSGLYHSIFACGLILLLTTASVNLAARRLGAGRTEVADAR